MKIFVQCKRVCVVCVHVFVWYVCVCMCVACVYMYVCGMSVDEKEVWMMRRYIASGMSRTGRTFRERKDIGVIHDESLLHKSNVFYFFFLFLQKKKHFTDSFDLAKIFLHAYFD